jgi:hypothetical protein
MSAAIVSAEPHVAHRLTRSLLPAQAIGLDAPLMTNGLSVSAQSWAGQAPRAPAHPALARLVEQGATSARSPLIRPAQACARFTAQRLRVRSPLRRRRRRCGETITRLADGTLVLSGRAIGRMVRP